MNEMDWHPLEDRAPLDSIEINGASVRAGSRVKLRPRKGADIIDIALAGQIAIVEGLEEDYEGRKHVAVVLEADPGRDLGMLRQPGHRFFFSCEEIEQVARDAAAQEEF